jgi:hypothetical protein
LTNKSLHFIISLPKSQSLLLPSSSCKLLIIFEEQKIPFGLSVEKSADSSQEFRSTVLVFKTGFVGAVVKFEFKKKCVNPVMGHRQGDGNSLQHLPSVFFVSQPANYF